MAGPPPKRCHTATTTEPFITDDYDAIAGKSVVDRRMWFVYCNIIYSAITLQLCVVGTDIATIGPNHNNNVLLQLVRCVFSFLGCTHTHTHTHYVLFAGWSLVGTNITQANIFLLLLFAYGVHHFFISTFIWWTTAHWGGPGGWQLCWWCWQWTKDNANKWPDIQTCQANSCNFPANSYIVLFGEYIVLLEFSLYQTRHTHTHRKKVRMK